MRARAVLLRCLAVALAVTSLAFISAAHAQEIWTCSYEITSIRPLMSVISPIRPLIVHFRQAGDFMIDEKTQLQFRILQNNSYGLIAALSTSEIESDQTKPTIGAEIIIINKQTGEILSLTGILGHPEGSTPFRGACVRG